MAEQKQKSEAMQLLERIRKEQAQRDAELEDIRKESAEIQRKAAEEDKELVTALGDHVRDLNHLNREYAKNILGFSKTLREEERQFRRDEEKEAAEDAEEERRRAEDL